MIGTGVFTSLGFQLLGIQSFFVLMMLWLIGGLTALCGALTYAELGANLPRSGGEYNFLSRLYHPAAGFISGWVSATVGFAAPVALAAMTFGAYLSAVFPDISSFFGKTMNGKKINNASDFAIYLLEEAHVATVTGDAFGSPNNIRISYAASNENIINAVKRIKKAVLIS